VNTAAVVVGLIGAAVVAWMPWAEQATRQTRGFEYKFDNAVRAGMYLLVSYGTALLSAFGVLVVSLLRKELERPSPGQNTGDFGT
jgi:hypothetical protein